MAVISSRPRYADIVFCKMQRGHAVLFIENSPNLITYCQLNTTEKYERNPSVPNHNNTYNKAQNVYQIRGMHLTYKNMTLILI